MVSKHDYCISHHFNAGGGSGVEVIHSKYADGQFEHTIIQEFKDAGYPIRKTPVFLRRTVKDKTIISCIGKLGKCRGQIIEYDFCGWSSIRKDKR